MLNYSTQRNRKNIVLWKLLAADIQCIAYRVSCVSRIMRNIGKNESA